MIDQFEDFLVEYSVRVISVAVVFKDAYFNTLVFFVL